MPGQLVGVVGPNGCGKSNIIDAVRWVLGESRAPAAARRVDAGRDLQRLGQPQAGRAAPASSWCSTTPQGRAAGQWSQYAEIAVKRVLQRDGDSSYYINSQHVRRRDITDMFLGTGLGPRAYAIIEQGMISRVIEAKPEELRVFLEEAAGVSQVQGAPPRDREPRSTTRARTWRASRTSAASSTPSSRSSRRRPRWPTRYNELQRRPAAQAAPAVVPAAPRRRGGARAPRAGDRQRSTNELEAETAELRERRDASWRALAPAHYAAGDALQRRAGRALRGQRRGGAARVGARAMPRRRAAASRASTPSAARSSTSWREQRAQLDPVAARLGGARGGGEAAASPRRAASWTRKAQLLPQAEQAYRAAQEALDAARSALVQAREPAAGRAGRTSRTSSAASQSLEQRARAPRRGAADAWPSPTRLRSRELESGMAGLRAELAASAQRDARSACRRSTLRGSRSSAPPPRERAGRSAARACRGTGAARHAARRSRPRARGRTRRCRTGSAATASRRPQRLWQKLRIEHGWETRGRSRCCASACTRSSSTDASQALGARSPIAPPVQGQRVRSWRAHAAAARRRRGLPLASKMHAARSGGRRRARRLARRRGRGAKARRDARMREALPPGERDGEPRRPPVHAATRVSFHAPGSERRRPARAPGGDRGAGEALRASCARQAASAEAEQRGTRQTSCCSSERSTQARAATIAQRAEGAARRCRSKALQAGRRRRSATSERSSQVRAELDEVRGAAERDREALDAQPAGGGAHRRGDRRACARAPRRRARRCSRPRARSPRQRQARAAGRARGAGRAVRRARVRVEDRRDRQLGARDRPSRSARARRRGGAAQRGAGGRSDSGGARSRWKARVERDASRCEKTLGRGAQRGRGCRRRAARARGSEAAGRGARSRRCASASASCGSRSRRRSSTSTSSPAAHRGGADEELLATEARRRAARLGAAGRDHAPHAGDQRARRGEPGRAGGAAAPARSARTTSTRSRADLDEAMATLEDAIRKIDRETRELLRETFDDGQRPLRPHVPDAVRRRRREARCMTGEEILDAGVQVMAQPPGKKNTHASTCCRAARRR